VEAVDFRGDGEEIVGDVHRIVRGLSKVNTENFVYEKKLK